MTLCSRRNTWAACYPDCHIGGVARDLGPHFSSASPGRTERGGWQFFLDVVRQRPFYHDEMMRWLGNRFPSIRGANDDAVKAFLQSKSPLVH